MLAWVHVNGFAGKWIELLESSMNFWMELLKSLWIGRKKRNSGIIGEDDDKKGFVDVLLEIQRDESYGIFIDRESIKDLVLVRILL